MATKNLAGRISLLRKTTTQWNAIKSTVLNNGEIGIEASTDGDKLKIGDGVKTWEQLPYITTGGEGLTSAHLLLIENRAVLVSDSVYTYQIANYSNKDVVYVYINGLKANETTDYTLSSTGLITSKKTLKAGSEVIILINQGFVSDTSGSVITITDGVIQGLSDRISQKNVNDISPSTDGRTITISKADGTSFDFQGDQELNFATESEVRAVLYG